MEVCVRGVRGVELGGGCSVTGCRHGSVENDRCEGERCRKCDRE